MESPDKQIAVDPQKEVALTLPAGAVLQILKNVEETMVMKVGRPIHDAIEKQLLEQLQEPSE